MFGDFATILERDQYRNVKIEKLKKGDIVILQTGEFIPADLELIQSNNLVVDEFDITGELLPVRKSAIGETLYMGSKVTLGTGEGKVIATGAQTEFGRIMKEEQEIQRPAGIKFFQAKFLLFPAALVPAIIFFVNRTHQDLLIAFCLISFSCISILLQNDELFLRFIFSLSRLFLNKTGFQIKDPAALEKLSRVDVVCFDKTGVLTSRKMRVKEIVLDGKSCQPANFFARLSEPSANFLTIALSCCNDVHLFEKIGKANPVDISIIHFMQEIGIDMKAMLTKYPRVYEKPFTSEERYMAVGLKISNQDIFFVKGDAEVVLNMCKKSMGSSGKTKRMPFSERMALLNAIKGIQRQGGSGIAFAFSKRKPESKENNFTFLGLLWIENSLNRGAKDIVQYLKKRGIRPLILSGDRADTIIKIGVDVGITTKSQISLTGRMMNTMDLNEVGRQAEYCSLFSRLTPSQKGVIIYRLQQRGHHAAMIGDGFNDVTALKFADVGISFIHHSSVAARRFSSILLPDLRSLKRLFIGVEFTSGLSRLIKIARITLLVTSFLLFYFLAFRQI